LAAKVTPDKGSDLERRVGRAEFAQGALVRLRWPVFSPGAPAGRRVLTDVDVMAVDYDARLRLSVSIYECKSVRGTRGEPDRLMWLVGLQRLIGADRAVLVRDTASVRGRELARRLNVDVLDAAHLGRLEMENAWLPPAFGHVGGEDFAEVQRKALGQVKTIGEFPGPLLEFLRYESLVAQPYRSLGALATLEEVCSVACVLPDPADRFVASHGFVTLLLAALRSGGRLDAWGAIELRRVLENGLTVGHPYDASTLNLLSLADSVMRAHVEQLHAAYALAGAKRVSEKIPSIRAEVAAVPKWLDRFIDLVERLRSRPEIARALPQTAELALFDALIGGRAWSARAFDGLFTLEHRQLLLVTLDAFAEIVPSIAPSLEDIRGLAFDRTPHVIADRREPYHTGQQREVPAALFSSGDEVRKAPRKR
jgi:hypothetical protein